MFHWLKQIGAERPVQNRAADRDRDSTTPNPRRTYASGKPRDRWPSAYPSQDILRPYPVIVSLRHEIFVTVAALMHGSGCGQEYTSL